MVNRHVQACVSPGNKKLCLYEYVTGLSESNIQSYQACIIQYGYVTGLSKYNVYKLYLLQACNEIYMNT